MRIQLPVRTIVLVLACLFLSPSSFANYPDAKKNPDGKWVLGGAYSGAKQNPDGTWVLGGAYIGAKQNPDGKWVCGGAYNGAKQNPDGTWVVGWKKQKK